MKRNEAMPTDELVYLFNERAAIAEFDGNLPRDRAEIVACRELQDLGVSPALIISIRNGYIQ